jgi:opacity protein-like surface antigen
VRFGWATGNLLPYGALGLAFGRADLALSTSVFGTQTGPNPNPPPATQVIPFAFGQAQAKNGAYLYGYSAATGLDYALTQHVFARGEYEYIQWQRFWSITSGMHNFRAAVGVKF